MVVYKMTDLYMQRSRKCSRFSNYKTILLAFTHIILFALQTILILINYGLHCKLQVNFYLHYPLFIEYHVVMSYGMYICCIV